MKCGQQNTLHGYDFCVQSPSFNALHTHTGGFARGWLDFLTGCRWAEQCWPHTESPAVIWTFSQQHKMSSVEDKGVTDRRVKVRPKWLKSPVWLKHLLWKKSSGLMISTHVIPVNMPRKETGHHVENTTPCLITDSHIRNTGKIYICNLS